MVIEICYRLPSSLTLMRKDGLEGAVQKLKAQLYNTP